MTWTLTSTGIHFDLVDPQPDMINLLDICRGLSREARFNGQTRYFYSVAQHCELASRIVPDAFALEALLHDASEAYIKDIPRPLKQMLPDYRKIEQRIEAAIRDRFGLPATQSFEVDQADRVMLATEKRDMMPEDATEWPILRSITPLDKRITPVSCYRAETLFMARLLEVFQQ